MSKSVIIVGSGLGGLLSGALLSQAGYQVSIFERLAFPGGRFTSFDYQGFKIPTGALHTLPGGKNGPLGKIIHKLGLDVEIIVPNPGLYALSGGRRYSLSFRLGEMVSRHSFLALLSFKEKLDFANLLYETLYRSSPLPDIPFLDFVRKLTSSPKIIGLLDKLCQFTLALTISEVSVRDMAQGLRLHELQNEGTIKGGCQALTNALIKYIQDRQGSLKLNAEATKILIKDKTAVGVELSDGQRFMADMVISNAGPKVTISLLGGDCPPLLPQLYNKHIPAYGITYSLGTDKPLVPHNGIELPLDMKKLAGYIQVSASDPGLAPPGKHLLLVFQAVPVGMAGDFGQEITDGISELQTIFPRLSREEIANISTFKGDWSVFPTALRIGQGGGHRYPVKVPDLQNLYMIGYDSEGHGIAAEIIGYAAMKLVETVT